MGNAIVPAHTGIVDQPAETAEAKRALDQRLRSGLESDVPRRRLDPSGQTGAEHRSLLQGSKPAPRGNHGEARPRKSQRRRPTDPRTRTGDDHRGLICHTPALPCCE